MARKLDYRSKAEDSAKTRAEESGRKNSMGSAWQTALASANKYEKWTIPFSLLFIVGLVGFVFRDFLQQQLVFMFTDIGSDSINIRYPEMATLENAQKSSEPLNRWSFYDGMGNTIQGAWMYAGQPDLAWYERFLRWLEYALRLPLLALMMPFQWLQNAWELTSLPWKIGFDQFRDISATAIVFYAYVRTLGLRGFAALTGTLFFAFSGYQMIGSTWLHTSFSFVFALFAFEQFLLKKRWYFLPLAFFYINNYNYYFVGVFMALYGLMRYFYVNPLNWKKFGKFTAFALAMVVVGTALNYRSIQSSLNLFKKSPRGDAMFNTKTVLKKENSVSYANPLKSSPVFGLEEGRHYTTAMMSLVSPNSLGVGNAFKGWKNYLEGPLFYCSILVLLLLPQGLRIMKTRQRAWVLGLLGVYSLIVVFPFFRYAYYAYVGDYYKAALNIVIPIVLMFPALIALDGITRQGKSVHLQTLLITAAVILGIIYFPFEDRSEIVRAESLQIATFTLLGGTGILALAHFKKQFIPLLSVALLLLTGWEMTAHATDSFSERQIMEAKQFTTKRGYNDYTMEALDWIRAREDSNAFYRIEKNYSSSPGFHVGKNDGKVQMYFGTQSYSSFNQVYITRFEQELNLIPPGDELASRWSGAIRGVPALHGFGSLKYTLMSGRFIINHLTIPKIIKTIPQAVGERIIGLKQPYLMDELDFKAYITDAIGTDLWNQYSRAIMDATIIAPYNFLTFGYKKVHQIENILICENPFFLPLGFAYDKVIPYSDFTRMNRLQKERLLNMACVVENKNLNDFEGFARFDTTQIPDDYSVAVHDSITRERRESVMEITDERFHFGQMKGRIALDRQKVLFFSIPYDRGWKLELDGKRVPLYLMNVGFMGAIIPEGDHELELYYGQHRGWE